MTWDRFPHYWLFLVESIRRWISHPKTINAKLVVFFLLLAEYGGEQTANFPVIWEDVICQWFV